MLDDRSAGRRRNADLQATGQGKHAASLFEKTGEVRPEDYQSVVPFAGAYRDLNLPDRAETTARRAIELIENHLRLNPDDERALYLA